MITFETITGPGPLRVVQVGAGGMGKAWIRTLQANPDVELVGLVDLNLDSAKAAVAEFGLHGVALGTSVTKVAGATGAQAVINVTVPAAHHPVNIEAMFAGLPVLCEKPVAPTVAEGLSLVAAAEVSGQLLMISQSRRYFHGLTQLKAATGQLGDIGLVTTEFFKAPHFGGFREEMEHVLLVDMAVHQFDAIRFLLDQDPVSVYCEEFNPSWSWYDGNAAATAVFQMSAGTRYTYTGSWCADGLETSWNGTWRVNGAAGTAAWDGEGTPRMETLSGSPHVQRADHAQEIAGALEDFVTALRTGAVPSGEVHSNILSLAMVEAAVKSASVQQKVLIRDVIEEAYQIAIGSQERPDIRMAMESWESPLLRVGRDSGREQDIVAPLRVEPAEIGTE